MPDKKPLDTEGGTPAQKDRLNKATEIQSPVLPEDYPLSEREGQVTITGKGKPRGGGAANK